MNFFSFKTLAAYGLLAVVLIAGSAYVVYGTNTFSEEMKAAAALQAQSKAAQPVVAGRVETFGKNSPVITSENVNITYERGVSNPEVAGPTQLNGTAVSVVTHGDASPVVIGKGNSITITYK